MSSGQMSFWENVLLCKSTSGQKASGQMYFWANVFLGKRLMSKCLSGQISSGQTSHGQMSKEETVISALKQNQPKKEVR
jgi:hypothetical protein